MNKFPNRHAPKKKKEKPKMLDANQIKDNWDTVLEKMNGGNTPDQHLAKLWDIYMDAMHSAGLITDLQAVSITNPYTEGSTILSNMR